MNYATLVKEKAQENKVNRNFPQAALNIQSESTQSLLPGGKWMGKV